MSRLLLHVCCGPCSLYPLSVVLDIGFEVTLYFFNPNIHPLSEYIKRLESFKYVCHHFNLKYVVEGTYGLVPFLQKVVFHESERCSICYDFRLENSANYARLNGYDAFSTTLLYSRYQNHQLLIDRCSSLSSAHGLDFFYRDFRLGWKKGIDDSKALGLYRQSYCGCVYSEQDSVEMKLWKKKSLG